MNQPQHRDSCLDIFAIEAISCAQRHLIYVVRTNKMASNGERKKRAVHLPRHAKWIIAWISCLHARLGRLDAAKNHLSHRIHTFTIQILTVAATQLPAGPCRQPFVCVCAMCVCVGSSFVFRLILQQFESGLQADYIRKHKLRFICLVLWYRHKIQDPKVQLNEIV